MICASRGLRAGSPAAPRMTAVLRFDGPVAVESFAAEYAHQLFRTTQLKSGLDSQNAIYRVKPKSTSSPNKTVLSAES